MLWNCWRRRGTISMEFKNRATGASWHCGEVRGDTPPKMILDWILTQSLAPSVIQLMGQTLVVLPEGRA